MLTVKGEGFGSAYNTNTNLLTTLSYHHTTHHNRFTAPLLGPPGWAGTTRELLDFMVQGKINTGRHTDHPAGCHSIWTKQCPRLCIST